jgi:hypothetical protein
LNLDLRLAGQIPADVTRQHPRADIDTAPRRTAHRDGHGLAFEIAVRLLGLRGARHREPRRNNHAKHHAQPGHETSPNGIFLSLADCDGYG